ncbi:3D-(3,5/4)-trihydroxycyclohexane-1,2-dione acylhydrolase (decyclizing) [Celerinatantimonas diazotrophica]|uniref:3D-(3,5/4)-trihydroxycyclohexane-1,2-dione hydrolase n=1 Tax=Celerinatantimonas diazotrophica TaxID=412034 RepID=A0A4R1JM06_9GAMM|nr:3D-(3,5/4)-trihydroxycyclohexane-1,2-dione acylhydrolase (decyclizing) [Celerinatantimonas diazotrophica]TCK51980.1 3D-(3,5/4)-trihydroxycyclohexane-1,2-dione hydrolase [Celerinatantimonas diazotrophica]CAG9296319.1 3D-(3,5/4)-trihydroxycyclohexane-1,2-dione hydrolase [Celerinatantimonas diazotrophica]
MKTTKQTVAQALVRFLDNQYLEVDGQEIKFIKGIFAIFGHGNVLGLGQALEQNSGDLRIHQGRNEQGMAHAAIGFAKQSLRQQIFACTSSVGPGAANMITAAATATANHIPLLLLPGDTYATRQPDPVLQQVEQPHNLTISTNDAFQAVSKYWDRISRPEQLMTACINAIRVLTDPAQTGAVTLALPQDVQGEAYDYPDYFFSKRVHRLERQPPTDAMLSDAKKLLTSKKRPIIIFGGGAKYSLATAAILQFAEQFDIPIAETQAGKGAILSEHPLNVGGIGETGCIAANQLAPKADLVIGIGTRYTDFTTASKWIFQDPDVDYLNININRFDAFKLDGVQIIADAKTAVESLLSVLAKTSYSTSWGSQIQQAKEDLDAERERVYQIEFTGDNFIPEIDDHLPRDQVYREFKQLTGSVLTQSQVLGFVNNNIEEDAVIVGASGSLPGDLQRIWKTRSYNSYHMEYGYSCMGYEVNAALGAKLANPQREVYSLVGDGSFMMLHSELVSSIQENQKINIILFDNIAHGCINNLQIGNGMNSFFTEFRFRDSKNNQLDGKLIPVDYAKIAEGYGCKAYRVTNIDELKHALADAQMQTVSTLIDIKILPKTMLHGYLNWWRVGLAEQSDKPEIRAASQRLKATISKARQY